MPTEGTAPYLFLSHARQDADDELLVTFFKDLSAEVGRRTSRPKEDVAYRDTFSLPLGQEWRPDLVRALSTCEVLVPIVSPSLVVSPNCGKEWHIFSERLRHLPPADPGVPSRILPLLWQLPVKNPPPALTRLQYTHGTFGATYAEFGLRHLAKLSRYRDDYVEFLGTFAAMIQDAAESAPVPAIDRVPEYDEVLNAFDVGPAPAGPASASTPRPAGGQCDNVLIVIVAADAQEIRTLREDTTRYGDGWKQWRPFHPRSTQSAALLAQSVAPGLGLTSQLEPLGSDIVDILDSNSDTGGIAVILADPWSARLARAGAPLRAYDKRSFLCCNLVQVWDDHDTETMNKRNALRDEWQALLPNQMLAGTAGAVLEVSGGDGEFREQLVKVVTQLQSKAFALREIRKRVEGGPAIARPQISAATTG